jgi:hypothetical protein
MDVRKYIAQSDRLRHREFYEEKRPLTTSDDDAVRQRAEAKGPPAGTVHGAAMESFIEAKRSGAKVHSIQPSVRHSAKMPSPRSVRWAMSTRLDNVTARPPSAASLMRCHRRQHVVSTDPVGAGQ